MILSFILLFVYVGYKRTIFSAKVNEYTMDKCSHEEKGFLCLCMMELPMVYDPIGQGKSTQKLHMHF